MIEAFLFCWVSLEFCPPHAALANGHGRPLGDLEQKQGPEVQTWQWTYMLLDHWGLPVNHVNWIEYQSGQME